MNTKLLTHADAELVLRLYDLRRETVMRESRNIMNGKFWPKTAADVLEIMNTPDHAFNAAFRQVTGYWEMVYSFAKHGIIDADFLVESNGEGIFVFSKIQPFLTEIRQQSATAFLNAEWMIDNSGEAKRRFDMLRARVEKILASKA